MRSLHRGFFIGRMILLGVLSFAALSTPAVAGTSGDAEQGLAASLRIRAANLLGGGNEGNKAPESRSLREVLIPVSEQLSAFVECSAPWRSVSEPRTEKIVPDIRAVFGFHFPLR